LNVNSVPPIWKPWRFSLKEWPRTIPDRQAYVDPIFAKIATRYDFMTRALSLGQEQRWKAKAVSLIPKDGRVTWILDLASGTGDFPLHLRKAGFKAPILGLDRSPRMLGTARQKCTGLPKINFVLGDLMQVPLKDHSFDVITMGYGLRYVADIPQTLKEVFRLLRRGGLFVCLDFGVPKNALYRRFCFGYLLLFGTLWGLALHGKGDTYWHIVESLKAYPGQETVREWLEGVGFIKIELRQQLAGMIVVLSGIRP
jgi:demethylmenaquinone methyltransferase/2-methoxy-6-polyprenyl-1,4-benzoquinol methylase